MTKDTTLRYRVGELEKVVCRMDKRIDMLMENHLPHLQQTVKDVEGQVETNRTRITMAATVNIGAILLAAALLKFL